MASDPAGGNFIGLQLGRKLASLPQSGSIEPARRLVDAARSTVAEPDLAPPAAAGVVSQSFAGDLAPATAVLVTAQVERELDAAVLTQNRETAAAAAAQPVTKGKPMTAPLVEIKGLGNAVAGFRKDLADVRSIAADVSVSAGNLKAELADVKAQIEDARTQIKDEAATLGNSAPGSAA